MDTITQVLLGASIGAAFFQPKIGRAAIVIGGLGGLLPDLDLVSSLGGPWASLVHHRGLTHALAFGPAFALPLGWLSHRVMRRRHEAGGHSPGLLAHHAALWALALMTHPLLDAFTTYGTQLLWPFSNARISWDGVSIIDLVYSGPLTVALVLCWQRGVRAQHWAQWALAFTTAYLFAGFGIGTWVEGKGRENWEAISPTEVRAIPTFANLLYWRVLARTESGDIHVGNYSLLGGWAPQHAVLPALDDPRIATVLAREEGRILTWFSEGWIGWRFEQTEAGTVLWGEDQRYGLFADPTRSMMAARVTFTEDGQTIDTIEWVQDRRENLQIGTELGLMWQGIRGRWE